MFSRSFSVSLSILALAVSSTMFAGCAADTDEGDSDEVLQSAEALTSESTEVDSMDDANVTDGDVEAAIGEAAEQDDAPEQLDIGCGFRQGLRARIKAHFDTDGDGKLDAAERQDLKDAVGGHPRMKIKLVKMGIKARHHVFKRVVWAYDTDGSGTLDATERAALSAAVQVRCEARKARALANFDKDGDGKLDDGELRAAIQARLAARVGKLRAFLGRIDANKDGKLDDAERDAVRTALRTHYMDKRAAVKAKFDVNADGKLDDAEIAALKAAIRARFETVAPGE